MALKEKKIGNYKVTVDYCEDDYSPREMDDLSVIYSNHLRYSPDKHSIDELIKDGELDMEGKVGLSVWMYEHSGCAFRTTEIHGENPFGNGMYARFDSGWFGIIAMPIEKAKVEWGDEWEEKAKAWCENQIGYYDAWCNGRVYGYTITDSKCDVVGSCGGFYEEDEAFEEGVGEAEYLVGQDVDELAECIKDGDLHQLALKFCEIKSINHDWFGELVGLADCGKAKEWLQKQLNGYLKGMEDVDDEWEDVG